MTTKPDPDWGVLLGDLFMAVGNYFFDAWAVMITLSVIHGADHSIPNLGYWNCLLIVWAVQCLLGTASRYTRRRVESITPMYAKKPPSVQADAKIISDLLTKYTKTN